jgi:hypothetical protein
MSAEFSAENTVIADVGRTMFPALYQERLAEVAAAGEPSYTRDFF